MNIKSFAQVTFASMVLSAPAFLVVAPVSVANALTLNCTDGWCTSVTCKDGTSFNGQNISVDLATKWCRDHGGISTAGTDPKAVRNAVPAAPAAAPAPNGKKSAPDASEQIRKR